MHCAVHGGGSGIRITQPWYRLLAIFEAVGLGLALPFLAIAFSPGLRRFLPKPGVWMLGLKQFLAFPVYGTAVWLSFVLAQEAGEFAVTAALAGLVLIAFAAWLYETARLSEHQGRRWGAGIAALAIVGAIALLRFTDADRPSRAAAVPGDSDLAWLPFSTAKIDELRAQGKPIFVDFSADWCITCKINERVALTDRAVLKAFADCGVVALALTGPGRIPASPACLRQMAAPACPSICLSEAGSGRRPAPRHCFAANPHCGSGSSSNTGRIGRRRRLAGRSEAPLSEAIQ